MDAFARFLQLASLIMVPLIGIEANTLCIDGGGSKTLLQLIDANGTPIVLIKDGKEVLSIQGPESNINTIGIEGVRSSFVNLLSEVKTQDGKSLNDVVSQCKIVAGMAGIGLSANREKVLALFKELGVKEDNIILMTDADMALSLLPEKGMILISGTGSICLGKDGEKKFRVGGLGNILGDEGSGYQIGLMAVKSALAKDYGWGPKTTLTEALKEFSGVRDLKTLIPLINSRQMTPAEIAKFSSLVFREAANQDAVAQNILKTAAHDLHEMIVTMLKISELTECEIHLWGGVFKNTYAAEFIQQIEGDSLKSFSIKVINRAYDNAAVAYLKR